MQKCNNKIKLKQKKTNALTELLRKKNRALTDNNHQQLAIACKNIGDFHHENQQYENALDAYTEEARIYERLGKNMEKARAHRMIGEMYMLLENFNDAIEHEQIYLGKQSKYLIIIIIIIIIIFYLDKSGKLNRISHSRKE